MDRRSSARKANWSITREAWYKEESDKILFDKQLIIKIENDVVYLLSADTEEFLLQISKPKTMWYEIWLS